MNGPPDLEAVVKQWMKKAENDLVAAEHILKIQENCPFDTVGFHAQQCAEKYLKALLTLLSVPFPKSHDFRVLLQRVPEHIDLKVERDRLLDLNRYAAEERYPGDYIPISRADAERAVETAKKIKSALRGHLPSLD